MSNVKRNVYTENVHLRNRFNAIYKMIRDNGFISANNSPSALGIRHPMIMEIFRIARKEREIERVIQEKT